MTKIDCINFHNLLITKGNEFGLVKQNKKYNNRY
jgi:hypothetical protein